MITFISAFLLMTFFHLLADFPLQGDFLSKAKNHLTPIHGVPWLTALLSHSAIHAGFVWLVTGYLWLAVAELIFHAVIDYSKCEGEIDFNKDQIAHLTCKGWWALILVFYPTEHWLKIQGWL